MTRAPPHIPEVVLPKDIVLSVASALRIEINRALEILRDIASGKDLKKFLVVCASSFITEVHSLIVLLSSSFFSLVHVYEFYVSHSIDVKYLTLYLQVIVGLWIVSILGNIWNFLTLFYIGK